MQIEKWCSDDQICRIGNEEWSVQRMFVLSKDFPVYEANINTITLYYTYNDITLRDFVTHMKAVNDCSLDYPIILSEDGELMDGRHRIMKALLTGAETIKIVRFDKNPPPCKVYEE